MSDKTYNSATANRACIPGTPGVPRACDSPPDQSNMATNDPKTHFEPFKDAPRRSSSLDSSASHGSESASGAGASAGAGAGSRRRREHRDSSLREGAGFVAVDRFGAERLQERRRDLGAQGRGPGRVRVKEEKLVHHN